MTKTFVRPAKDSGCDRLAAGAGAPQCGHCPVRGFVWIMTTQACLLPLNHFKDQLRSTDLAERQDNPAEFGLAFPDCRQSITERTERLLRTRGAEACRLQIDRTLNCLLESKTWQFRHLFESRELLFSGCGRSG